MNIFEALRQEHEIQRDLVAKLVETHGDTEERKDLTQEKARHSVAEHHEMDELIEELEDTEMDASNWLKIAKELEHKVTHHLDEEEQEVFQMAGKALTEKQKTSLAEDYNKEIKKMR